MPELKDLLLKKFDSKTFDVKDIYECNKDIITSVYLCKTTELIKPDYVVGRCCLWVDDNNIIKFITVEQPNGKILRVDSEPPLDTSDWPKRARLHRIQDPWS